MVNAVKEYRKERNITQQQLATMVGISRRYLSSIEGNKTVPSIDIVMKISNYLSVNMDRLFMDVSAEKKELPDEVKFIDLFCGIGGFRYGAKQALKKLHIGDKCVFSSDIDKFAQDSYEANFGIRPVGDITKVDEKDIPDFDILFGGFPKVKSIRSNLKR